MTIPRAVALYLPILASVVLVIASCGGGGGGDASSVADASVPRDAGLVDTTVPTGPQDAAAESAVDACVPDAAACAGRCGQLADGCGQVIDCGGCEAGLTCGGGGAPNTCGSAPCVPTCANAACGASDGCGGICSAGTCAAGTRCVGSACVCDFKSCLGCCSFGVCQSGNTDGQCGFGGNQCATCGTTQVCDYGFCDPCGRVGEACCAGGKCGAANLQCNVSGDAGARVCVCVPNCTGAACGAADGCGGTCQTGACASGQHCSAGACLCDATSCSGCCSGTTCQTGNDFGACGTAGAACVSCTGDQACVSSHCGPVVMLYGGHDSVGNYLGDTWLWDGAKWTADPAADGITASYFYKTANAGMSSLGGRRLLYGGEDSRVFGFGYLWEWKLGQWQLILDSNNLQAPAWSFGMAPLGPSVVFFGGEGIQGPYGGTWLTDGTTFTQASVTGPSPTARAFNAMATLNGQIVMFGGAVTGPADGGIVPWISQGDTWTWNGSTWTQRNVPGPSPRAAHSMVTLGNKVLLFGGESNVFNGQPLGDTWVWDGASWTQLNVPGPSPRSHAAMAVLNGNVVLFGGEQNTPSSHTVLGDTWQWDGATWTSLAVTGPSSRSGAAASGP